MTLFLGTILYSLVALKIPDIRTVSHYQPLQTTTIYDRNGKIIERIFVENRIVIPFEQMPVLLTKSFVAAEDGRFFDHPGLDALSVFRAALNNLRKGGRRQGGSTITQQVAKSLLLSPEKTYLRKFKEAILAWRIDNLLTKEEILYIYLNQIYLGEGAYGVESASQIYFSKSVRDLTLAEMALLAGLPQAPSKYTPYKYLERARKRQRYVLNRMATDGYISVEQARSAFARKVELKRPSLSSRQRGYYTQIVKGRAERYLGTKLDRAGVKIHTFYDSKMQEDAVQTIKKGLDASMQRNRVRKKDGGTPQGAMVSINGCTGDVIALVGGRDFVASPFDRATMARRPAGSIFKPLVYSEALSQGWRPNSLILDAPLSITDGKGGLWKPKNFSGSYHGQVTLSEALTHSYNTAAIRLLQNVGLNKVQRLAKNGGIESPMPSDLSLALGAVDVSLLEMTGSYLPFVCSGYFSPPRFIDTITDGGGKELYRSSPKPQQVLQHSVAKNINTMLQNVINSGTGKRARGLAGKNGGKTGTSNNNRDAWFIGFHGRQVTGVWVGNDDNKSLGRGENGGKTAAPIWLDYLKKTKE